ncbi:MAG: hypothetical protein WC812_00165 [Candidatus Pacearchaeota archaeon]|jgi:hypothetical protein
MSSKNPIEIKERIINILKAKGPSLPMQIAKDIGMESLFASAFLSELASEKRIKISNMRVGSSPIYFLEEKKDQLEKFSQYLKDKEKEAFLLLKEKKILKDKEQSPVMRIALRSIKDFSIPFQKNDEIFWRYFLEIPENEKLEIKEEPILIKEIIKEKVPEKIKEQIKEIQREIKEKPKKVLKKIKKKPTDKNDKFFNNVKDFLFSKKIEILDIMGATKNELSLKVIENSEKKILIAINKKRISENELIKSYKTSKEENLPFIILSLGEFPKKLEAIIAASKNLSNIYKLE